MKKRIVLLTVLTLAFVSAGWAQTLWEWKKSSHPWTSLGTNTIFYANGYDEISVRAFGTPINNDNGGIKLGGIHGQGGPRLAIGQSSGTASNSCGAGANITGEFDLTRKRYRLTIDYENVIQFGTREVLRVMINNNSPTMANSPLGSGSTIQFTAESLIAASESGASEKGGKLILILNPAEKYADNEGKKTLENAFFGIMCLHDSVDTGTTGNWLTITGIKIERID